MNDAKSEPFNLADYEQLARERLPRMVYDYYAGGAGDEVSVRENELAWSRVRLRPRVLVDVSACDLSTTVLGRPVAMPVLTAPCGMNVLAHPDGELAVARATAAAGIVQVLSTLSGHSLEDIASAASAAGGAQWFQLYCYRDRGITRELVARAEAAGFLALCVTVDVPVLGYRERDARNRFHLPPGVRVANITQQVAEIDRGSALLQYVSEQFDPSLTWESVDWLRSITRLPVVLKGVLAAEDARLAVEHGAAGVIVSNHGGRQLDGTVAPCDALPEIAEAVARAADAADTAEVYVDGGIRRGVDVLKALALGARAVLIGRPYLWALAADGEAGVLRLLHMLRDELQRSLALAGCPRARDVRPALIAR